MFSLPVESDTEHLASYRKDRTERCITLGDSTDDPRRGVDPMRAMHAGLGLALLVEPPDEKMHPENVPCSTLLADVVHNTAAAVSIFNICDGHWVFLQQAMHAINLHNMPHNKPHRCSVCWQDSTTCPMQW